MTKTNRFRYLDDVSDQVGQLLVELDLLLVLLDLFPEIVQFEIRSLHLILHNKHKMMKTLTLLQSSKMQEGWQINTARNLNGWCSKRRGRETLRTLISLSRRREALTMSSMGIDANWSSSKKLSVIFLFYFYPCSALVELFLKKACVGKKKGLQGENNSDSLLGPF